MKKLLLFILVFIGLLSGVNAAQINFATAGSNTAEIGFSAGVLTQIAQTFQGNNENITTLSFYYFNTGTPASNINVTLRAQNGTNASHIPLRYALLNKSLVTGTSVATANLVTVTLNSSMNVTLGTNYWIVFQREDGLLNNTNYITIVRNSSVDSYANGSSYQFTTLWTSLIYDLKGYINTTNVVTPTTAITFNSPLNNSYYNSSVLLNISINTLSNLSYSLNGGTNTLLCLNCNSSSNITLSNFTFGTQNLTIFANNTANSNTTINFYYDNTIPSLNISLSSEYNYYTGFNFSQYINYSDSLGISSCIVTILGLNSTTCNNTNYNFSTNGNKTINITLTDLAGNINSSLNNIMLINPYQYFRAYDSARLVYVTDTYTLGTYTSNNTYIIIPLYDLGLGNQTLQFDKSGYISSNYSFTFNTTSGLNTTFNVTPVTIIIQVFDEDAPTTQLYFNLTYITDTNSTIYLNQLNFSKYYNDTFTGNLTLIFDSINYSTRKLYTTLSDNSATSHIVYLKRSSLSTSVIFQTLDLSASSPIEDVEFVFQKYINGTLTFLAEAKTDSSGYTYFNMGLSEDYQIIITKGGYVTQTINSIPGKTSYTILMEPENVQQGFAFQGFSYKFIPIIKQQSTLPFNAGVNVVDSDNLLSSWTITVTGDNTSFTQTSINSAGGLVEFNITNASIRYMLNLSGMRDGNYFEFIDYVSYKNQSTQVTTLITQAQNMDNDPDATYDKVMLILIIYVIFVVLGTIVSFGNSSFGAMLGLIPITFFVYLSWLPLGFAILFGVFTILGVLYFQK